MSKYVHRVEIWKQEEQAVSPLGVTVVECYRILPNKNREVMVRIAYNGEMAKEVAKKAVRQELEKKGEKLHDKLDKALGF